MKQLLQFVLISINSTNKKKPDTVQKLIITMLDNVMCIVVPYVTVLIILNL